MLHIRNPHHNEWVDWHIGEPPPSSEFLSEVAIFQADGEELKYVLDSLKMAANKPTGKLPTYRVTYSVRFSPVEFGERTATVQAQSEDAARTEILVSLMKAGFQFTDVGKMEVEEASDSAT